MKLMITQRISLKTDLQFAMYMSIIKQNMEIKCHKFSIMHLKNKIMSYLCKITVVYHSEGVKLGEDPKTGVVNQTVF